MASMCWSLRQWESWVQRARILHRRKYSSRNETDKWNRVKMTKTLCNSSWPIQEQVKYPFVTVLCLTFEPAHLIIITWRAYPWVSSGPRSQKFRYVMLAPDEWLLTCLVPHVRFRPLPRRNSRDLSGTCEFQVCDYALNRCRSSWTPGSG